VSITPDHDPGIELARQWGDLQGSIDGRRAALSLTQANAYLQAFHHELSAAGLCDCPDDQPEPDGVHVTDLTLPDDHPLVQGLRKIANAFRPNRDRHIEEVFDDVNEAIDKQLAEPATDRPAPTAWCGDLDHDDPCDNCDTTLTDAAEALRQRMPEGAAEPDQENWCADCGDTITNYIGEGWKHMYDRDDHDATPANLTTPQPGHGIADPAALGREVGERARQAADAVAQHQRRRHPIFGQ